MVVLRLIYENEVACHVIRNSWAQVTYEEFTKILENAKIDDPIRRLICNTSVLSGLPVETIAQFDINVIRGIMPYLDFIDSVDGVLAKDVPEHIKQIDIGQQSWHKLEACKMLIQPLSGASLVPILPAIAKEYTGQDITHWKMPEAYPIARYFAQQLEKFFSKYTRLNDYVPEDDQRAAGLERLNQYGFFSTLHALAKGNPLHYDEMLNQPADVIYQTLVFDFELSEYQKRLTKLKTK